MIHLGEAQVLELLIQVSTKTPLSFPVNIPRD